MALYRLKMSFVFKNMKVLSLRSRKSSEQDIAIIALV